MLTDFILASIHHICVFALLALLGAQLALVRPGMNAGVIAKVGKLDRVYGIIALAVLLAGLARVFEGAKGPAYYFANHIFLTKFALFIIAGLLSIRPTLDFIAWNRALKHDLKALPADAAIRRTRLFIHIEATLLILLPVLAAAMARGYGSR